MAANQKYNTITKYHVIAICKDPLHIGSADGNKEAVLVHPVDGTPFVQATSIAGAFRGYMAMSNSYSKEREDALFGSSKMMENGNSAEKGSLIRFTDARFTQDTVKLELRPRVKINAETGSCDSSTNKGTNRSSGHKFNMEYIGAGAEITFDIYLYGKEYEEDVEMILSALNSENILFGGQKSNGCGAIQVTKALKKSFDMKNSADRMLWGNEEAMTEDQYEICEMKEVVDSEIAYEITVSGKTEGELLVKGIVVPVFGEGAPDATNIQNAKEEYIVPGSSFKGAVRNQMETIVTYLQNHGNVAENVIVNTFGTSGKSPDESNIGNIRFCDTVIGNKDNNDKNALSHRIHIDKFTGGVMHGGLFAEKNIYGDMSFKIVIMNRNQPEASCGVLIMALRDLAIHTMNVGGGYNVGKGFINVDTIEVIDKKSQQRSVIDMKSLSVQDDSGVISNCLQAVSVKEA